MAQHKNFHELLNDLLEQARRVIDSEQVAVGQLTLVGVRELRALAEAADAIEGASWTTTTGERLTVPAAVEAVAA